MEENFDLSSLRIGEEVVLYKVQEFCAVFVQFLLNLGLVFFNFGNVILVSYLQKLEPNDAYPCCFLFFEWKKGLSRLLF